MKNKAIFKFNNGNPVMLCSDCRTIIKYISDFTEEEKRAMKGHINIGKQYCEKCNKK